MFERPSQSKKEPEGNGAPLRAPSISLPKGGGAIRGMGEKFAANPVTGTGSMTIPIAVSPGRSGFGPQLSLSYDSGAGNGIFGFGWSLSLPSITRKTDKGLPKYQDAEESDVFILSGAEDLVPVLVEIGGQWQRETLPPRTVEGKTYHIQGYRPRIEGLFARIERWTNETDPKDSFWRSITKDNIATWYGKTAESRIADPADATRIFSWLICQSYDDQGNAIVYQYAEENSDGVDLSQAHEKNRTPSARSANRYLKRIHYGNRQPNRDAEWNATDPSFLPHSTWMFEVVVDYGDHDLETPLPDEPGKQWSVRNDPFSPYRAGFEVRTYRLCQRVLMFHHFPSEEGVGQDCLVRSTDFTYSYEKNPADSRNPIFSFLLSVTESGYKRQPGGYLKKSLPPLEFEYTEPAIDETLHEIDSESLENLPYGLDGGHYQWVDLDGEGLSGVLTEQAEGWLYKRNLSPVNTRQENGRETVAAHFAPIERVAQKPSLAAISSGRQQLLDLAGDGQVDLVELEGPTPGFYERTEDERWEAFVPFTSLPNLVWDNPNLKFVDLTGDGHADILISDDEVFCWHPSLAEAGFAPPERVRKALDEEKGPKLVLADGTQSIYLSDMSGDGLTDLVRIRNGEVCYWPNLGYGHFGAKVTMDNAPWFDRSELFDQRRIRLADIDGSGVTDILYLSHRGVQVYFNQSGNRWSAPTYLTGVPATDNVKSVTVVDLLGNGTACLVWSSPLSSDVRQPMRYLHLMGGQKPHLLVNTVNNLGAETHVQYAPSTKFYLADKLAGKPWITRLPFPVHVVERVETLDRISGNRFVTRYTYHHGYFDGPEREFRGFGMAEQFDTEQFSSLAPIGGEGGGEGEATNIDEASHVPPVLTRTWFHTGLYVGRDHVSNFFAGLLNERDVGEYYREPGLTDAQARQLLLDDTVLPDGLTAEEEREACRALKGSMLRQEVYALDGTEEEQHPYTVAEQNFTVRLLQPRADNRHAVFLTHAREAFSYHYERNPADPRLSHALTLEVDDFGDVLKSAVVGYGRRQPDMTLPAEDQAKQTEVHITYTENSVTNAIEATDDYRTPLPCESRTYELTGLTLPADQSRFTLAEMLSAGTGAASIDYEQSPTAGVLQKRLIEHVHTLYRPDDLGAAQNDPLALLPLGTVEPLALPGESYKLAFTPGLLDQVYVRSGQKLLPANPADVLEGGGPDRGGYVDLDGDANWWIPSGHVFFSPGSADTPAQEFAHARQRFFLPHRYRDPFHTSQLSTETVVNYDDHTLLVVETRDPLGNTVHAQNDYRVLGPRLMTDPNGNRSEVAFDALGMVVSTAVKGKPGQNLGDLLEDFHPDPPLAALQAFVADPRGQAASLLGKATTRIVYDLERYPRSGQPPFAATLARETHFADPGGAQTKIQVSFSYSDGFGREIQKKIQAEGGDAPQRGPDVTLPSGDVQPGALVHDANGKPVQADTPQRWVGRGRTAFNNKGKPVRQYEPFFSATHLYEEEREMTDTGVSPILFYDPVERVVATLHPNHTWEKVVFDPWQQTTYDVNDTVTGNPKTDDDVKGFFTRLPDAEYLPTWHEARKDGQLGPHAQAAAEKAADHADTPTVAHADSLGRTFLTIGHNRFERNGALIEEKYPARVVLDIEGNKRQVIDALNRIVMRYDYDVLGTIIHQINLEAGERWTLNDATGNPIRGFDSRGHGSRSEYDPLRRPLRTFVTGADLDDPARTLLTGRMVYGEQHPAATALNLRGSVYLALDQAGAAFNEAHDFKGNRLVGSRRPAADYKHAAEWAAVDAALPPGGVGQLDGAALQQALAPLVEDETFTSRTVYDALSRSVQAITPHSDRQGTKVNVVQPIFNEANLLERVNVWLNLDDEPNVLLNPATATLAAVRDLDYDVKGQRMLIEYGNGVRTTYEYDPLTFRLRHLLTMRSGEALQELQYTYDPSGNITHIQDDAQQTVFFDNQVVEPSSDYTYDAIYRLIEASGREHLGQAGSRPTPPDAFNSFHSGLPHPGDAAAMGRYTERYEYDFVGNFQAMKHFSSNPALAGWTRTYHYDEESLIEPGKVSNRLTSTTIGGVSEINSQDGDGYDAHGNMLKMAHLPTMEWDYRDQLQATSQQVRNGGTPETTYYTYDGAGQRVRKITERQAGPGETPTIKEERIYLGGFEIFRQYTGDGSAITLERETLHIMDDQQRIAMLETKTIDNQSPIANLQPLVRFQLDNHLGSASLELDGAGQIISYEEYFPYGSTSYQAVRTDIEVPAKRYRYTGMERDEENSLNYHGARYYAPWLGRWVSADPDGIIDGLCLYQYVRSNPIILYDPSGTNGEPLPGLISNDPRIGGLWEKAVVETLGPGLKANTYADVVKAFKTEVGARMLEHGGSLGSNRRKGTAINYARESYSKVRSAFGKLAKQAGVSFDNKQLHHIFDHLATNPWEALNTTNLQSVSGHAAKAGTGHNFAHKVDDARKAGSKTPARDVYVDEVRAGRTPDVPELSPGIRDEALKNNTGSTGSHSSKRAVSSHPDVPSTRRLPTDPWGGMGLAKKAGKVVTGAGIALGLESAGENLKEGNYISAVLDLVGLIPGIGDLVDLTRLGYALIDRPLNRTGAYNREHSLGADQSIMKGMGGCQRCHTTKSVDEWTKTTAAGKTFLMMHGSAANPVNDLAYDTAVKAYFQSSER